MHCSTRDLDSATPVPVSVGRSHRRGGEQRVVVEHVHIHAGAQAIVGAVTHTGGPRALIENQGQPHATTAIPIVVLWDRRGPEILERLADEEPAKIAAIAYGILPKEAFVKIENQLDPRLKTLQNMDADALAALGGLINAIKEAKADGCEPGTVFAWVEEDLRARMAVPVEKSLDRADNDERQAANNRNGDERASR